MYIIFHSALTHGHLNVCIAIGRELMKRDHRVAFIVNDAWSGRLAVHGFEVLLCPSIDVESGENGQPEEIDTSKPKVEPFELPDSLVKSWRNPDLYKRFEEEAYLLKKAIPILAIQNDPIEKLIMAEKPDFIMVDTLLRMAYLTQVNIPWARVLSCNPLFCDPLGLPPAYCGLSINSTETEWNEARTKRSIPFELLMQRLNLWYSSKGVSQVERFFSNWHSPYINFYLYPKEVDYFNDEVKPDGNWIRIDSCVEQIEKPISLPSWFQQLPGKPL
jgi:hypothetical protein